MTQAQTALPGRSILIGDSWLDEASGGVIDHVNPATGKPQATVTLGGKAEMDAAVAAAQAASQQWGDAAPAVRRRILNRIGEALESQTADLARLCTLESGIPATFAYQLAGQVVPEYFFYNAGWCEKLEGAVIPAHEALDYTLLEPYGVVGVIIPWNAPLISIGQKVAPALAAGNAVVLKPPELAPFSAARFAEICLEAGLPPGVLNVVPGGPAAGETLVSHPGIGKITFTGSTATAQRVLTAAAANITPAVLELGGKSANILFADCDLHRAVLMAVMMGVAALSGQGCVLPTRLLVEAPIYDTVVEMVKSLSEALVVGDPSESATVMGPVISAGHCDRIQGVIDRAREAESGILLTGGARLQGSLADGYYIAPTVFCDVDPASELAREEIFGPVLSVFRFGSEAEALSLANDSKYGLAAYVWTADGQRAHRVARRLESGTVGINTIPIIPATAPFGGYKQSGYGREGGRAGVEEFLRTKNIYLPL